MKSQPNYAEYFRTLADFLRKDLHSSDSSRKAGAVFRIRKQHAGMAGVPDAELPDFFRKGDALNVIAGEQGFLHWRDLVEKMGGGEDVEGSSIDIPNDGRTKRILVSFGNSSVGPVGGVAWVFAETAEEALEIAKAAIPTETGDLEPWKHESEVDYIEAYFNPEALTLADIEDWEYADT